MYTTIKLKKTTKKRLEEKLIEYEKLLGKRIDYDELINILIDDADTRKHKPELLLELIEINKDISEEYVEKAHMILENEAELEERAFEEKYGSRHKRSS